ncbi:iron-siderophore ABC transporter substrate-binding protein [Mycobacterium rufum]|uniref:Iron-siderophore ABC transporter substrate-binding protein n=1 Tax=Mycolicibacterium rufum TaxID=318424 RepID=A0A9X3BDZ0_9MYCO|nr:Fe3+-citrate ABC transporter substrate-binding protein [Mycolicibacterium rufum]MCV7069248.1 iron-siderophore ABC transporter substrate-binding protein [Mycolicibacterium rufum]
MSVRAAGAAGALAAALVLAGCGGSGESTTSPQGQSSVVTSTTRIASAGVLGNDRRPDESCAPDPAPLDDGPAEREVGNATGHAITPPIPETTVVPADPQRIVALAGDQLDALCALGLQSRIVAAALPEGSQDQPSYLGTAVHDLPAAGTRSDPDLDAIRAANPDVILGSVALTPEEFPALTAIAPTVFSGPPGVAWKDNLRAVGAATGRLDAANRLIDDFDRAADKTGADNDAVHFQASVVQFTDTTLRIFGTDNFPATVLADVGVDRPAAQRFTDKPYVEVGITDEDLANSPDFSAAEGDLVYVSFATAEARERAPKVMGSDAWKRLSANRDNRVLAVNNEIWQTGEGIVAARGIMADLRLVNAPIN